MAGDPFTSAVFGWLNRVVSDDSLPPRAFKLAYVISQHINRTLHTAWPSQETLAEAIGLKPGENITRTVRRLTDALVAGGHLIATQRKQTSMLYRLAAGGTRISYTDEPSADEAEQTRPDISDGKTGHFCTARPDNYVRQTTERTT